MTNHHVLERARTLAHYTRQVLHTRYWFPHVPLSILLIAGGLWLLHASFGGQWHHYLNLVLHHGATDMPPNLLPPLLIGGGLVTMALAMLWRSRTAWLMTFFLTAIAAVSTFFTPHHDAVLTYYFLAVLVVLLAGWRSFDRSSLAASTVFAVTSVLMVVGYSTFGAFYLGSQFHPEITDLVTALYFSMVTMSTVGYGDITPATTEARLFVISVIVLGLTVFATSLTAVVAPMLSQSMKRLTNSGKTRMKREKHFVVVGNTPLAVNTWRELAKRGRPVTRIVRSDPSGTIAENADAVIGDAGDRDVLEKAGAGRAAAVLAMTDDDSENAFIVLAVKDLHGNARTVAAVNDANRSSRIRLVQPDITISPQVLGGELIAMVLSGEEISADSILARVLQRTDTSAPPAAHDTP
ncbi:MAG TPA: ion channel [Nevskiaceae bacterium]